MEDNSDRISRLLTRKLMGTATKDELAELGSYLATDPGIRSWIENFYKLWTAVPGHETEEDNAAKLLKRISDRNKHIVLYNQRKSLHQDHSKIGSFIDRLRLAWRKFFNKKFSYFSM